VRRFDWQPSPATKSTRLAAPRPLHQRGLLALLQALVRRARQMDHLGSTRRRRSLTPLEAACLDLDHLRVPYHRLTATRRALHSPVPSHRRSHRVRRRLSRARQSMGLRHLPRSLLPARLRRVNLRLSLRLFLRLARSTLLTACPTPSPILALCPAPYPYQAVVCEHPAAPPLRPRP